MSDMELVLNMLAGATATERSKIHKPIVFDESREIAKRWANSQRRPQGH